MIDVGIDLHRKRSQIAALDEQGRELLSRRVANEPEALKAQPVERLNRFRLQRHRARAQSGLGVLDPAVCEGAPHIDDVGLEVDVVLLEPEEGRSPFAPAKITIGPYTGPS